MVCKGYCCRPVVQEVGSLWRRAPQLNMLGFRPRLICRLSYCCCCLSVRIKSSAPSSAALHMHANTLNTHPSPRRCPLVSYYYEEEHHTITKQAVSPLRQETTGVSKHFRRLFVDYIRGDKYVSTSTLPASKHAFLCE